MSRARFQRITSGTAICAVLCSAVAIPFGAWAQANDRGGMWTQLRLAERFVWRDIDRGNDATDGVTTQLVTDLDLAFRSDTRNEAVTLDFGAGYRFSDGPTTNGYEGQFDDPTLRLSYRQTAASAGFQISARATQIDLFDVDTLSAALAEDGTLDPDFADIDTVDGGTRTQLGLNSRLSLRDDAPFGMIFDLSVTDISYQDLPDTSTLRERTTLGVAATGRFDITKVLQARLGLHYTTTDTQGLDRGARYSLQGDTTLTQPTGTYSLSGVLSDGDGGDQASLTVGRSYSLPQTEASFALGATKATSNTVFLTGSAGFEHDFGPESAFGTFTAAANRSVTLEGRTDEEVVTSLSLAGTYALTPLANLRLSAELGQSEDVASGETVDLSQVNLTLGYQLGRDWRANAGVRAEQRRASDADDSDSTTLSLGITRTFDVRH